jgi:hypothetical protein
MNLQVGTAQNLIREQLLTPTIGNLGSSRALFFLAASEHMAIARFKEE